MFLLIWALLLAPFIIPLSPSLAEWEHFYPLRVQLYRDLVGAVTMLVATWVMTRFVDRRPLATIGFDYHRFLRDFLPGFAVGSGWLAVSLGSVWAAGWLAPQPNVVVAWSNLPATAVSVFLNVLTQQTATLRIRFSNHPGKNQPCRRRFDFRPFVLGLPRRGISGLLACAAERILGRPLVLSCLPQHGKPVVSHCNTLCLELLPGACDGVDRQRVKSSGERSAGFHS